MNLQTIKIERRNASGYETSEISIGEALPLLNTDLQNEMTIWIDNRPFSGTIIQENDLLACKKQISVTNKLVGG